MKVLPKLVEALEDKEVFHRDRKEMETRALGMMLYHHGVSLKGLQAK